MCRFALVALAAAACSGSATDPDPDAAPRLAPELGAGDHSAESVGLTTIANASDNLFEPRDLAFNPRRPDELWIVSHDDDSTVIVSDASTPDRTARYVRDVHAFHFMDAVSAIAFGADETSFGVPGTFATCGESRNHDGSLDDFMGPTLWSSDLSIYGQFNPIDLGSHLDMLHCSPLCMGIAHQEANIYWVFGGLHRAIFKYDFHQDHDIGQDDHSDGEAFRYAFGQLGYVPGVPSHLEYDAGERMLYIADTAGSRIAKLDTTSGTPGQNLVPLEPMATFQEIDGATITDVVPASSGELERPSGIALHGDLIYVSDNATSRFSAFTRSGTLVNWLDSGLPSGSLAGIAFGPDGKIYFVDMIGERVLRIDP